VQRMHVTCGFRIAPVKCIKTVKLVPWGENGVTTTFVSSTVALSLEYFVHKYGNTSNIVSLTIHSAHNDVLSSYKS
jgi:hypothetical protein